MAGLGDVVARLGHSRRMLIVDIEGEHRDCAWRSRRGVHEARFHVSALRVLQNAKPPQRRAG